MRQQEKRRARWRRNKRAERARRRSKEPPPPPPEFVAKVLAERDRRLENYPFWLTWNTEWLGGRGSYEFQGDVWAARTILEKQFGRGAASTGKIAKWMTSNGRSHGYKAASLRTMVWRALKAVAILEAYPRGKGGKPHWPICESIAPTD